MGVSRPRRLAMAWSADGQSIYAFDMTAAKVLEVRVDGTITRLGNLSDRSIALGLRSLRIRSTSSSAHAIHADVWLTEDFDPDRP
jgi:hypothetical protein